MFAFCGFLAGLFLLTEARTVSSHTFVVEKRRRRCQQSHFDLPLWPRPRILNEGKTKCLRRNGV
jgi:hypothetical protein